MVSVLDFGFEGSLVVASAQLELSVQSKSGLRCTCMYRQFWRKNTYKIAAVVGSLGTIKINYSGYPKSFVNE